MDPAIPKTDAEWWARRRIIELEQEAAPEAAPEVTPEVTREVTREVTPDDLGCARCGRSHSYLLMCDPERKGYNEQRHRKDTR